MAAEEFKQLTPREHILTRPGMYVGNITPVTSVKFINGKQEEVQYIPALLKITNEIIDNSIDEFLRSEKRYATKIDISINKDSFSVTDNGRGIPIEDFNGKQRPYVAWCETNSGTSFGENRIGPSANGVGSVITNIFSNEFIGTTCDGRKTCVVTSTKNMSEVDVTVTKDKGKKGTRVEVKPDFQRLNCTEYDETHIRLLRQRVVDLSVTYPKITFNFNDEEIKYNKPTDYLSDFSDTVVFYSSDNYFFGIMPSITDDFMSKSTIEGLDLSNGGSHETYIIKNITELLRDMIKKKYKLEILPSEIKRGLMFVFIGTNLKNMLFDNQMKERLVNSEKEIKTWLGNIPFESIAKDVFSKEEIIQPIIETKLAKQLAAEKRAMTLAQKKNQKKNIDNYIPSKNSHCPEKTTIVFCEGLSAASSFLTCRDINKHGCYPLKGMPLNTYEESNKNIIENKEMSSIMNILGLNFQEYYNVTVNDETYIMSNNDMLKIGLSSFPFSKLEVKTKIQETEEVMKKYYELVSNGVVIPDITYDQIGIMTDSDTDGIGGITPLLLVFFYKFPQLYIDNRVKIVKSPRYIFTKFKGKTIQDVIYAYTEDDFNKYKEKCNGYELRYIKGLGTLRKEEYKYALDHEENWTNVVIDDPKLFSIMFSGSMIKERKKIMSETKEEEENDKS